MNFKGKNKEKSSKSDKFHKKIVLHHTKFC